ncbi:hypothetical protein B0T18DRAFT_394273 [Schizothecium vesticola]|uniref:Uncharacterized protein n=1 Tax=Schizothecium vesticola TaxID=314040 RepID=A0AA40BP91_9PEZI|nr:hypothetical protein B0T18DRAFT_394273 [Schizothecium vesticola]
MVRSRPGLASGIWTWAADCAGLVRRFGPEPEPEPEPNPDGIPPPGPTIPKVNANIDMTKTAMASPGGVTDRSRRTGRATGSVAKIRSEDAAGPLRTRHGKRPPVPQSPGPAPPSPGNPASVSLTWLHRLTTFRPHPFSPQLQGLSSIPLLHNPSRTSFLLTTLTAITLNHLRRTLHPALAAPIYHTPLHDLRLARSNPAYFLDEALSVSWTALAVSHVQKLVWDSLAGWAVSSLGGESTGGSRRRGEVMKVVYLVWMLASVEIQNKMVHSRAGSWREEETWRAEMVPPDKAATASVEVEKVARREEKAEGRAAVVVLEDV